MSFSRMILSENKEQRTLAIDFCSFLLFNDKNLSLGDLVGYDQKSRDFILKNDFIKVWETIAPGLKGPPSSLFLQQPLVKSSSQDTFIDSRTIDEEEIKRSISSTFSANIGSLKVLNKVNLQQIDEVSEHQSVATPKAGPEPTSKRRLSTSNPLTVEQLQHELQQV